MSTPILVSRCINGLRGNRTGARIRALTGHSPRRISTLSSLHNETPPCNCHGRANRCRSVALRMGLERKFVGAGNAAQLAPAHAPSGRRAGGIAVHGRASLVTGVDADRNVVFFQEPCSSAAEVPFLVDELR